MGGDRTRDKFGAINGEPCKGALMGMETESVYGVHALFDASEHSSPATKKPCFGAMCMNNESRMFFFEGTNVTH